MNKVFSLQSVCKELGLSIRNYQGCVCIDEQSCSVLLDLIEKAKEYDNEENMREIVERMRVIQNSTLFCSFLSQEEWEEDSEESEDLSDSAIEEEWAWRMDEYKKITK